MRCTRLVVPMIALLAGVAAVAALGQGPTYQRGRTPSPEEIRAWDIAIGPEGKELPPGSGTAKDAAQTYAQRCAKCHGPTGTTNEIRPSRTYPHLDRGPLVGGQGTLTTPTPMKTVGSYWPYATTVWDFINRAMPPKEEGTLSADEVYSLTALLLYWNGIIKEGDVLDAKSLPKIEMPNRNGFVPAVPVWPPVPKKPSWY
jgi:S-disulfanyl-L-cysteine oxidoreductase SoxD